MAPELIALLKRTYIEPNDVIDCPQGTLSDIKALLAALEIALSQAEESERRAKGFKYLSDHYKGHAERYLWLREQDWFDGELCVLRNPKEVLTRGSGLGADCPSHSRLDEAIDSRLTNAVKTKG